MKTLASILGARKTVTIDRHATVAHAARVMAERGIGALPVLVDHRIAGIFSERDVLVRVVAAGRDPRTLAVGDVMTTDLVVADISDSYPVCLERMQRAHVRHLIVRSGDDLAGLVSLRDLVAIDLEEKADELAFLHSYVR